MRPWVIRGLVMAVLHAAASTAVAKVEVFQPTGATLLQAIAIAILVGAAALWSAVDAWLRRPDGGQTWFIAGLVAGPVSGILYVIGRAVLVDQTGVSELWPAVTGGAAFTALLVMVPAGLGLFVGGKLDPPKDSPGSEAPDDIPTDGTGDDPGEQNPPDKHRGDREPVPAKAVKPSPVKKTATAGKAPVPTPVKRAQGLRRAKPVPDDTQRPSGSPAG